jgi:hypothetical protein
MITCEAKLTRKSYKSITVPEEFFGEFRPSYERHLVQGMVGTASESQWILRITYRILTAAGSQAMRMDYFNRSAEIVSGLLTVEKSQPNWLSTFNQFLRKAIYRT